MQLSWSDRDSIARALIQTYPDTDRIALTLEQLKGMVNALPGFEGPPEPPRKAHLESILWTWMRLADEDGG
jgi:FeS assembly protein IscX